MQNNNILGNIEYTFPFFSFSPMLPFRFLLVFPRAQVVKVHGATSLDGNWFKTKRFLKKLDGNFSAENRMRAVIAHKTNKKIIYN